MSLTLHTLLPAQRSRKREHRVGRGGKRGTYSGRGIKGQRARSGGRSGLKQKGFRRIMKQTPKLRGFRSFRGKIRTVALEVIERNFSAGAIVSVQSLHAAGILPAAVTAYKVIGKRRLSKVLTVRARGFSERAREAIVSAGGKAVVV